MKVTGLRFASTTTATGPCASTSNNQSPDETTVHVGNARRQRRRAVGKQATCFRSTSRGGELITHWRFGHRLNQRHENPPRRACPTGPTLLDTAQRAAAGGVACEDHQIATPLKTARWVARCRQVVNVVRHCARRGAWALSANIESTSRQLRLNGIPHGSGPQTESKIPTPIHVLPSSVGAMRSFQNSNPQIKGFCGLGDNFIYVCFAQEIHHSFCFLCHSGGQHIPAMGFADDYAAQAYRPVSRNILITTPFAGCD